MTEITGKFMTAQEAVRAFINAGLSESTFRRWVRKGVITKQMPEGRQRGALYLRSEVLQAVAQEKASPVREEIIDEGETDWVCSHDLPYLQALDYELYGPENTVPISITHAWWEKNPRMCRILFDKKNRKEVWGAITIMPMQEETIAKILRDEIMEKDITPDDILVYENGCRYHGYIASAMVRPEHKRQFRKLLESVFDFWCEQYPRVQLIKLHAFAASVDGEELIRHLFFSPRYDLGENAFELDPYRHNPSKLIKRFQDCIARKN